jgi:hypothetical protein
VIFHRRIDQAGVCTPTRVGDPDAIGIRARLQPQSSFVKDPTLPVTAPPAYPLGIGFSLMIRELPHPSITAWSTNSLLGCQAGSILISPALLIPG